MEKKQYFRGTTLIQNGYICSKCYQIQTGIIEEKKENQVINIYKAGDYILLNELLTSTCTTSTFIAKQNCSGVWISKTEILENARTYLSVLASQVQKVKKYYELLQIQEPIVKISRYLFYEYELKNLSVIYLTITIEQLCKNLSIKHSNLLETFTFLENKNVIARKNKLINIINVQKLKFYAFNN